MSQDFSRYTVPPKRYDETARRKNLLLDMDGTLLHTFVNRPEGLDESDETRWFVSALEESDGSSAVYYSLIRPGAREFVRRCCEHYDVYFFTAAVRDYAEPIFDHVFPEVPKERRLYREACQRLKDEIYLKNLLELNFPFDMRDTVLLDDNAPQNTHPVENGLFCAQFYPYVDDDQDEDGGSVEMIERLMEDNALDAYAAFLCGEEFLKADDVREKIHRFSVLMSEFENGAAEQGNQGP